MINENVIEENNRKYLYEKNNLRRNILLNNKLQTMNNLLKINKNKKKKIEIKSLKLPKLISNSIEKTPRFNHNKRIIKIRRKIFDNEIENNNNNNNFIFTEINYKKIKRKNNSIILKNNLNKNNNFPLNEYYLKKIHSNKQFGVSELLINDINDVNNKDNEIKKKIITTPNLNNLFLNKNVVKKNLKSLKENKLERKYNSVKNNKKMLHCFMEFQTNNNVNDMKNTTIHLNDIGSKINNIFEEIRNDTDYRFHQLLNSDKIEFD